MEIQQNNIAASILESMTFQLISSCQGSNFSTGICVSPIHHFAPNGSQ